MQSAHVTEWRHEVRRVLVDFEANNLLTAPIYRMLLKYNASISMSKLNGNKIAYESFQTIIVWFKKKFHKSRP